MRHSGGKATCEPGCPSGRISRSNDTRIRAALLCSMQGLVRGSRPSNGWRSVMWFDAEEWSVSAITFTTIFAVTRAFKTSCGALVCRSRTLDCSLSAADAVIIGYVKKTEPSQILRRNQSYDQHH